MRHCIEWLGKDTPQCGMNDAAWHRIARRRHFTERHGNEQKQSKERWGIASNGTAQTLHRTACDVEESRGVHQFIAQNFSEAPEARSGEAALFIGLLLLRLLLIHVGEAIVPECHGRLVVRLSRARGCTRAARVRRARAADLALQPIKACARVRRYRAADLALEFIQERSCG